jgi:hypothetical protein
MSIYDRIGVVDSDACNAMDGTVGTKCDFEIGIAKKMVILRIMGL